MHKQTLVQLSNTWNIQIVIYKHFILKYFLVDYLRRSSHWTCFVKKMFRKKIEKFARKHLCRSLFFIKLQSSKEETPKQVSLSILQNFQEHLFYRIPPGDCFFLYQEINLREFISLDVVKFDVNVKRCK